MGFDGQALAEQRFASRFWTNSSRSLFWQSFSSTQSVFYPPHVHSEFNVVICLAGSVEVRQWGATEVLSAGEALIGNALIPHQSTYRSTNGRCEAVSLTVDSDLFHRAMSQVLGHEPHSGAVFLGKASSPQIRSIAHAVSAKLHADAPIDSRLFEMFAWQLMDQLLRQWPGRRVLSVKPERVQVCLPRWQFVKTHELMLASSKADFRIEGIARQLGVSASRFHRLFRGATGESPAHYFTMLTLDSALERLRSTDSQIKQISYDLGFNSPSHFCSVFRKHFGVSPLEFRDSSGEGPFANA
jgi:AraC family transcriptional regulator